MKKPLIYKVILLLLLYCSVFVLIVMIQFARKGGFSQRIGPITVSGQYRQLGENEEAPGPKEYLLEGDASVSFGGMEFCLGAPGEESVLKLSGPENGSETVLPERMVVSDESVLFKLSDGTELVFKTQYSGGVQELRISCNFVAGAEELELPYKPLRKAGIQDSGDGRFIIISEGMRYSFGKSPLDLDRGVLFLRAGGAALSYGVIPEMNVFNPAEYILPQAQTRENYDEVLTRWKAGNFSLWSRIIASGNEEDLVIAYNQEAINRGTYNTAVSAIPAGFLNGANRTFQSSVYLGQMDLAYRSLAAANQEKVGLLSRLISEKSLDFLKEPHVFRYLAVRGYGSLMDQGAELARAIDPAVMALDLTPGVLEGYMDWKTYRSPMENPFERLLDQACFVISENLKTTSGGDGVFAFFGSHGEAEFNIRLGKALLDWAEASGEDTWAGVARSLIISVLSLGGDTGAVNAGMLLSEDGEISLNTAPSELTTAGLYRILYPGEYAPRALPVGSTVNSIWIWTAARSVSASQEDGVLDISVSFPTGGTHYLIVRGLGAFTKLQLYNMDYRSDPQFERYDSSGWSYIAQEQTLLLKMKHRLDVEHVRIFF